MKMAKCRLPSISNTKRVSLPSKSFSKTWIIFSEPRSQKNENHIERLFLIIEYAERVINLGWVAIPLPQYDRMSFRGMNDLCNDVINDATLVCSVGKGESILS